MNRLAQRTRERRPLYLFRVVYHNILQPDGSPQVSSVYHAEHVGDAMEQFLMEMPYMRQGDNQRKYQPEMRLITPLEI